jgi:hypothetical protein
MNHLENCKIFLRRWATVPPANVSRELASWQHTPAERHTCNTVACAGGWVPAMPEFAALGVTMGPTGKPCIGDMWGWEVAVALFGAGAEGMFDARGDGTDNGTDDDFTAPRVCTDHELVAHRINCQIKRLEASK